ncbi:MAG: hypothetical protein KA273_05940 [Bacteroidales bacterium]|nr:hypothetical protein [Bacteroidales bacterium]
MKTSSKTLNTIAIILIAFILSSILIYNYSLLVLGQGEAAILGLKIQNIIGLYLFLGITIALLRFYKGKLKPLTILISIIFGTLVFLLPYALTHLPWQMLLVAALSNLVVGAIAGYFYHIYKYFSIRLIVILLTILYSIMYFWFIYDYVWLNYVNIMFE